MKNQQKKFMELEEKMVASQYNYCPERLTNSVLDRNLQWVKSERVNTTKPTPTQPGTPDVYASLAFYVHSSVECKLSNYPGLPSYVYDSLIEYRGVKNITAIGDGFVLFRSPDDRNYIHLRSGEPHWHPFEGNSFYIGCTKQGNILGTVYIELEHTLIATKGAFNKSIEENQSSYKELQED